jgi:predicted nucleic acid-binding protein
MRVILDTNIFISYLLSANHAGTISTIVEAAFTGNYTLLLPSRSMRVYLDLNTSRIGTL